MNESSDRCIDSYISCGKLNSFTKILGGIGIHEQSLAGGLSLINDRITAVQNISSYVRYGKSIT